MPKAVTVEFISDSPYSQSWKHNTPKTNDKESPDVYALRTWREQCTADAEGRIFVPAMAFKQALDTVALRLGMKVPGKARATFTKYFLSGVVCAADVPLYEHDGKTPLTKQGAMRVTINANVDGIRGSGKRVLRHFPQWLEWRGAARFVVLDDTVTEDVFMRHFKDAGIFVGIGRFRVEKGGLNGRWHVTGHKTEEVA